MYTPKHVREKMGKMTFPELKKLAAEANNLAAFNLVLTDLKGTSELLSLEDVFSTYQRLAADEKSGRLHSNSADIVAAYEQFLMGMICFPLEMMG